MKFSNFLHSTEALSGRSSQLAHLDLAYLVVLPPLLLIMKIPMLIYLGIFIVTVLGRGRLSPRALFYLFMAGSLSIFFSLYGEFNYSGLSRLKLFVELILYLLILAVSLQRASGGVNIYLRISPLLLLSLSLFFFDSIAMLFYVILEIFLLLWIALDYRMRSGAGESLRVAALYFLLSIPWVVLLFIFFPRISFEHATYGFRSETLRVSGHDGMMYLDNRALLVPSPRIVMEVGFRGKMPPPSSLYFRGSVLYLKRGERWMALPEKMRRYEKGKSTIFSSIYSHGAKSSYDVTLHPGGMRWIYLLELPLSTPSGMTLDRDFVCRADKRVEEKIAYRASSAVTYEYGRGEDPKVLKLALEYERNANPLSRKMAESFKKRFHDPSERLKAIESFFAKSGLVYSLRPAVSDSGGENLTDDFLFRYKKGYCVHFASAFATICRMSAIPARIVTGFRGDPANIVKNFLIVRERDAHAWCEVYVGGRWLRVDPVESATTIEDSGAISSAAEFAKAEKKSGHSLELYILYIKYRLEKWILHYDYFRQSTIIERFRKDRRFGMKFILFALIAILSSLFLYALLSRAGCGDRVGCIMKALTEELKKRGYGRREGETMHRYLLRVAAEDGENETLLEIDRIYHRVAYGDYGEYAELEKAVKDYLERSGGRGVFTRR